MKSKDLGIILLIGSVSLLLPIFSPVIEISMTPGETNNIVLNIFSPKFEIVADGDKSFMANISYIENNGKKVPISTTKGFVTSLNLDSLDPGTYFIVIFTLNIIDLTISQTGLYPLSIIIFILVILIGLSLFYGIIKY